MQKLIIIDHPHSFMEGVRVLNLVSRNKDLPNVQKRSLTRVTHNVTEFAEALADLLRTIRVGERIYGTAGPRDVIKAANLFESRQFGARETHRLAFFSNLEARWASALNDTRAQADPKMWLFDCDTEEQIQLVRTEFNKVNPGPTPLIGPYYYPTKTGWHVLIPPIHLYGMDENIRKLLHRNATMLWAYWKEENP